MTQQDHPEVGAAVQIEGESIDLDAVTLSDEADDSISVPDNFGVIVDSPEDEVIKPVGGADAYLTVSKKDLIPLLRIALSTSKKTKGIVYKSVLIQADDTTVSFSVTNGDSYIQLRLKVLNGDDVLTDPIVVPIKSLVSLVSRCTATIMIVKRFGFFYISIDDGLVPLDTYNIKPENFLSQSQADTEQIVTTNGLRPALLALAKVVSSSPDPGERQIVNHGDVTYASHLWTVAKANVGIGGICIDSKNLSILLHLLAIDAVDEVKISKTTSLTPARATISSEKFSLSFPVCASHLRQPLVEVFNITEDVAAITIESSLLNKLVYLSTELSYTTGNLYFNYTDKANLLVSMTCRRGLAPVVFTISGTVAGSANPLPDSIQADAKLLRNLLRAYSGLKEISISLRAGVIRLRTSLGDCSCSRFTPIFAHVI